MAPKAKRTAAPKSAALNEDMQIQTRDEYKKLHNKLCFLARKSNDPDKKSQAQVGLQKLQSDRDEMIQKFKEDMSLSWLSSLAVVSTATSATSTHGETEWLNRYQMIDELKLHNAPDELVEAELESYPNKAHDNPVWAAQGHKKYQYTKVKVVDKETDSKSYVQQDNAVAPKTNKRQRTEAPGDGLQINYKVVIKGRSLFIFACFLNLLSTHIYIHQILYLFLSISITYICVCIFHFF